MTRLMIWIWITSIYTSWSRDLPTTKLDIWIKSFVAHFVIHFRSQKMSWEQQAPKTFFWVDSDLVCWSNDLSEFEGAEDRWKPVGNRSVAHFVAHFVAQLLLCGSCGSLWATKWPTFLFVTHFPVCDPLSCLWPMWPMLRFKGFNSISRFRDRDFRIQRRQNSLPCHF